jgi:FAD/FMN-containing dehydrogenase
MHRRDLLKGAAALPVAATLAPLAAAAASASASRVRPSDPAWPSAARWEALKQQVGGNLVVPKPLAAACEGAPDSAACLALPTALKNPFFIGDQPGGTQSSGWLDAWTAQQSAYAVAAHDAADVVAAVNFAREHNLRLVVKGGGHSYLGTSNAPDSLLVWTRAMNAIALHEGFVPKGLEGVQAPTPAVSVGSGAMWIDVYDAVTTKGGRYVQGGGCTTVGVAGLVQSGGFGSFSKGFGTAAANLLEAEIVTADGRLRTVNARQDPQLFWALTGGGGGSLGVITRLTLRTHDLPANFAAVIGTIQAKSDDAFKRLIARFMGFYAETLMNPHWGEQVIFHSDNKLEFSMLGQGLNQAEAAAVWAPFRQWVAAAPQDYSAVGPLIFAMPARGFWDAPAQKHNGAMKLDDRPGAIPNRGWWTGDSGQVGAFWHAYDSIWMPDTLLQPAQRDRLAGALFDASRHATFELHFNKGLAGAPPEALARVRDTATNPGVTHAFALAIVANAGPPAYPGLPGAAPDLAKARHNAAEVAASAAALRGLAPTAGSYLSESNYFNADWRDAYWGPNYPKLRAVKARYDPHGLFIVHHGVGSEDWSPDGFTRLG